MASKWEEAHQVLRMKFNSSHISRSASNANFILDMTATTRSASSSHYICCVLCAHTEQIMWEKRRTVSLQNDNYRQRKMSKKKSECLWRSHINERAKRRVWCDECVKRCLIRAAVKLRDRWLWDIESIIHWLVSLHTRDERWLSLVDGKEKILNYVHKLFTFFIDYWRWSHRWTLCGCDCACIDRWFTHVDGLCETMTMPCNTTSP